MDARVIRMLLITAAIGSMGATFRTDNFVVTAPTRDFAQQVGEAAEYYRKELAVAWLGRELPKWYRPCPVKVRVGQIGAGGATTFHFDRGEVSGWNMNIQGTEERILDSVLPHEISHTIFACYFRRPLPRWADEGAATLIEHESERNRQTKLLGEVMSDGTKYSLRQLLSIKDYPRNMRRVLTLYSQGYSLTDYLVQKKGRKVFLEFLSTADKKGWDRAIREHYGVKSIEALEGKWNNWVTAGSPELPDGVMVAQNETEDRPAEKKAVVRGQTPETAEPPHEEAKAGPAPGTIALEETAQEIPVTDVAPPEVEMFAAAAPAENEEPQIILHRESDPVPAARELADFQTKGRRAALLEGWVPVKTSRPNKGPRLLPKGRREISRPQFADERPVFVDETSFPSRN